MLLNAISEFSLTRSIQQSKLLNYEKIMSLLKYYINIKLF